ncbi:cytochrome P450 [Streptomyces althioticus]|uniref:Cytochrome P450 n=1 Tax=Streptomyces althioticus TaxID=83380 RepID=A0ABZ1Y0X0_9ACTN|nr:cytochrome P450 [Streptomyces griseorubens]
MNTADEVLDRLLAPGQDDPYPLYAELRRRAPVHFSRQLGGYVLTRFEDCSHVMKNPALFPAPDAASVASFLPEHSKYEAFRVLVGSIVNANPPEHTRLRRLVSRAFTARRVESLKQGVMTIATDHVDKVAARARDGAVIDFHAELSVPVPLQVLARLIGLPLDDDRLLAELIPRIINVVDPSSDTAALQDADKALDSLLGRLWELVERRRREPADDLVSGLVALEADGSDGAEHLSEDDLKAVLVALLTAGFETSATAIDISVHTLLTRPEHRASLRTYEGALRFVDEVLRWDCPAPMTAGFRYAAQDADFGKYRVPAGSPVRVLLGAANRDARANADPDRFDPDRQAPRTLVFGGGIHHCLGMNLARMEIAAVLMAIAERLPGLRFAEEPVRRRSVPLRDFASFTVRLDG